MNGPPTRSNNIMQDVYRFLLRRPAIPTLIRFDTPAEREDYSQRILQRLQIDVSLYSVLNIHRIGIEAPARYVFDEIMGWDGDSTCWPNRIAHVERRRDGIDHIAVHLFGWRRYPFGRKRRFLGLRYIPLFNLTVTQLHSLPDASDTDNARYVLFRCSGGYPIGHFCLFVRSPIAALGETERSQMFMMVGFDFYGNKSPRWGGLIGGIWEAVHNRVTANIMNLFKQLSEWRFKKMEADS